MLLSIISTEYFNLFWALLLVKYEEYFKLFSGFAAKIYYMFRYILVISEEYILDISEEYILDISEEYF